MLDFIIDIAFFALKLSLLIIVVKWAIKIVLQASGIDLNRTSTKSENDYEFLPVSMTRKEYRKHYATGPVVKQKSTIHGEEVTYANGTRVIDTIHGTNFYYPDGAEEVATIHGKEFTGPKVKKVIDPKPISVQNDSASAIMFDNLEIRDQATKRLYEEAIEEEKRLMSQRLNGEAN